MHEHVSNVVYFARRVLTETAIMGGGGKALLVKAGALTNETMGLFISACCWLRAAAVKRVG